LRSCFNVRLTRHVTTDPLRFAGPTLGLLIICLFLLFVMVVTTQDAYEFNDAVAEKIILDIRIKDEVYQQKSGKGLGQNGRWRDVSSH